MVVPFSPPDISRQDIDLVVNALTSGWITTGPKTKEFENKISDFCGTRKTVCLNSATACLETTLRIMGIGKGDEVITTAYTYTASASVIEHVGATPVLVDVDKDSFFMSPENVAKAITDKTKAIIPVDFAGVPVDPEPLYKVIEEKKHLFKSSSPMQNAFGRIVIICDAAHSLGASRNGVKTGGLCDFTCFSFHAVKNLTTAEGGAVTWRQNANIDDDELYKQYMLYSLHGQSKDALAKSQKGKWKYDIVIPGYKCNMTDVAAALGLSQLARYEDILKRRREIIQKYEVAFKDMENVEMLSHHTDEYESSYHLGVVRIKGIDEDKRDKLIEEISRYDVSVNVHYMPLPMMTAYKNMGFNIKDYPSAFNMYQNEITLPVFSTMTEEMQDYVIEIFRKVVACS